MAQRTSTVTDELRTHARAHEEDVRREHSRPGGAFGCPWCMILRKLGTSDPLILATLELEAAAAAEAMVQAQIDAEPVPVMGGFQQRRQQAKLRPHVQRASEAIKRFAGAWDDLYGGLPELPPTEPQGTEGQPTLDAYELAAEREERRLASGRLSPAELERGPREYADDGPEDWSELERELGAPFPEVVVAADDPLGVQARLDSIVVERAQHPGRYL